MSAQMFWLFTHFLHSTKVQLCTRTFGVHEWVITTRASQNETRFTLLTQGRKQVQREKIREWQLAQANRTTANGTLHLLLPVLQPTSGPTKSLSCCCCWEPHQIMTLFKINKAPNVWHGSFVEHEIWATNNQMLENQQWFLFMQSNSLFS